jgi:predicted amidohydrolase YtcJ
LPADLVLINTNIKTLNPKQPHAQAVALTKHKIVKVGSNTEIAPLIGEHTMVLSLEGKTVVPGLIDTHVHVADFGRCLLWVDLTKAESIQDVTDILESKAEKLPAGGWIIGRGWNDKRFKEKRFLKLTDLDKAAPNNPIILYHEAAYLCAVNSLALCKAQVTKQTPTPEGGTIDKDHSGELTGILRDSATNLVWQKVPDPSLDELSEATAVACKELVKAGLTSVHWIVLSEIELTLIQRLHTEGKLPLRVNVIVPQEFYKKAVVGFHSNDSLMLRLGGVFIAIDGYLDSKTAALTEPYSDDPSNSGKLCFSEEALSGLVGDVLKAGLQPVIHAMGDKAVAMALKVIEQAPKPEDIRFRLEQAALLTPKLLEGLKRLGVVVTVQPKVISTEFTVWSATQHLGEERAKWLHPLKTLLDSGIKVGGGSDCPMEPLSPLLGMQEVVERPKFVEQRLTAEQALRLYTLDAAYVSVEEAIKGSIEEGKLADFTVLSSDPEKVQGNQIKDVGVELVIVHGEVVT